MANFIIIAVAVAALIVAALFMYKKWYGTESFSGAFDPSVRLSIQGIGPEYNQPDECPNCQ
jgi:hypothetical protein